ncbi:MAG: tetratricopeptide repeat protein [Magnetococcales bacterium]|nr:tetratricopeptide repeat protein [Magnetococcales bacterium]
MYEKAMACYEKALEINPDYIESLHNLGLIHHEIGDIEGAIICYEKILSVQPDNVDTMNNYGCSLLSLGKVDEAIACFEKATAVKPDFAEPYLNCGNALTDQGRLDAAIVSYKQALQVKPDFADAGSCLLLTLNYGYDTAKQYPSQCKMWNDSFASHAKRSTHDTDMAFDREKQLRIGFISGDFHKHSVTYFLEPLFLNYDKSKMAFYCYTNSGNFDAVSERLRRQVDGWRGIFAHDDKTVADMVRSDGIDILVDLSGHTNGNRLLVFARKPAPLQVAWLGYPNTTGLAAMDYRITDHIADPIGQADSDNVEKLLRLPEGFLSYRPSDDAPSVGRLPLLSNGYITFASFNNIAKISPETLSIWSKILRAVPGSKLIIKGKPFNCPKFAKHYLSRFNKESIDSERIILLGRTISTQDHLAQYARVDIGVDTFPYNGTTTTCEALWMGVPVVVLRGGCHAGRVGASLLNQIGLHDLIANNDQEYVEKVVSLAQDPKRLEKLRVDMRDRLRNSILCDAKGFAGHFLKAMQNIWHEQFV